MYLFSTRLLGLLLLFFPVFSIAPGFKGLENSDNSDVAEEQFPAAAPSDSAIFLEKQKIASQEQALTAKTLEVARSFLGTLYATGTLDHNTTEQLVVNLRQLDCWTLMENSLAIAQTADSDFEIYQSHLQQLRYWGGSINGYGSRIHYFSGWLLQAEKNGHLSDLTPNLGGIPYQKKINYISARPAKYPKIRDDAVFRALKAAEKRINAHEWHYIPKSKVAAIEDQIQDGDLIMLTSAKRDLDISHQGFAVRQNGRIHLLHASSLSKRVIISKQPLPQYIAAQRGQSGIMVARLND